MTQFKFLTSWYQVPFKDCLEGMKPYLFDYANKEFFIYSAVNKTSYSIVTIGFYKEDKGFSNPVISLKRLLTCSLEVLSIAMALLTSVISNPIPLSLIS